MQPTLDYRVLDIRRGDLERYFRANLDQPVGIAASSQSCPVMNFLDDHLKTVPFLDPIKVWAGGIVLHDTSDVLDLERELQPPAFVQQFIRRLDRLYGEHDAVTGAQALDVLRYCDGDW